MSKCNACGKETKGGISIGGTTLCRPCAADVEAEIDRQRAAGKKISAMGIARAMYRERNEVGSYILRDIPDELWQRAKQRALDEGKSLRELILEAMDERLK